MCTEVKKMVMGEVKKAKTESQIMKGAEEVNAEATTYTGKNPVVPPMRESEKESSERNAEKQNSHRIDLRDNHD